MVPNLTKTHRLLLMRRLSLIAVQMICLNVKERQDKLPTMYWLPKLHKRPYKARFIASSYTTTELSKLLTFWLTAVKSRVIRYYETVYERSKKNMFWSIKILARFLVN